MLLSNRERSSVSLVCTEFSVRESLRKKTDSLRCYGVTYLAEIEGCLGVGGFLIWVFLVGFWLFCFLFYF